MRSAELVYLPIGSVDMTYWALVTSVFVLVLMAAKQHRNVDPVVFVAIRKLRHVRSMKETRFEQDGTVFAIRHNQHIVCVLLHKVCNSSVVPLVALNLPIHGGRSAANDQSATVGIEIGLVGREPKIDANGRIVRVRVDRRSRLKTFERPCLRERPRLQKLGQTLSNFVRNLKEKRAS